MIKTAFIERGGRHIYDSYNTSEWTDHSYIWALEKQDIKCKVIGDTLIRSHLDLIDFDAIIFESKDDIGWYMNPLLDRDLKDRPIFICNDINSYKLLFNDNYLDNYHWLSRVDITTFWSPYGRGIYEPIKNLDLYRPVPPAFKQKIERYSGRKHENYIFHPLRMRNQIDLIWQTCMANKTNHLHKMYVPHTEIRNDYLSPHMLSQIKNTEYILDTEQDRSPTLEEFCDLLSSAWIALKPFEVRDAIGGRASYMAAIMGVPYISAPSLVHKEIWPDLCIGPDTSIEDVLCLIKSLEEPEVYNKQVRQARESSRIKEIENGGRDWNIMVDTIKEHHAYRRS